MDEPTRQELRQWLVKGEHDLGSAQRLMTGEPAYMDTAVYHCQQAAEKALKAYLTFRSVAFPKTHDLTMLLGMCEALDADFGRLQEATEVLTPYATAFRYPGPVLEPTPEDAIEALSLARSILRFVVERLVKQAPSPLDDAEMLKRLGE